MTVRYLDFNNWKFNWITNPINQTNPMNQTDPKNQTDFSDSQSQRSRRMRLAMAIAMAAGQTRGRSGKAEESVITN